MSGNKSSLGKLSWESVMESVVASIALPKNLIALLPYRTRRSGIPEAYCPGSRCTPQDGMGKNLAVAQCSASGGKCVEVCVYGEERPLLDRHGRRR